jgi:thiamine phosphate synthase YjbQ (UPF0047 family)
LVWGSGAIDAALRYSSSLPAVNANSETIKSPFREKKTLNPDPNHYHNRTGEDNADAYLKRQVMGREVVVAITNGKLDLGPWEQIVCDEFDGHPPKRVLVKDIRE